MSTFMHVSWLSQPHALTGLCSEVLECLLQHRLGVKVHDLDGGRVQHQAAHVLPKYRRDQIQRVDALVEVVDEKPGGTRAQGVLREGGEARSSEICCGEGGEGPSGTNCVVRVVSSHSAYCCPEGAGEWRHRGTQAPTDVSVVRSCMIMQGVGHGQLAVMLTARSACGRRFLAPPSHAEPCHAAMPCTCAALRCHAPMLYLGRGGRFLGTSQHGADGDNDGNNGYGASYESQKRDDGPWVRAHLHGGGGMGGSCVWRKPIITFARSTTAIGNRDTVSYRGRNGSSPHPPRG